MHGIAAYLAESPDRWLASAEGADRDALAFGAPELDFRPMSGDRAWPQLERGALCHKLAPRRVVGRRQQLRHRHVDKVGVAVERLAVRIGELGALDLKMDK